MYMSFAGPLAQDCTHLRQRKGKIKYVHVFCRPLLHRTAHISGKDKQDWTHLKARIK
jgi:hypothetical protein